MPYNWNKHYAIKNEFDKKFGWVADKPGIYLWTRQENGITYFYVGQAKNLYNRRFDYYKIQCGLSYPTRHFEASLKKHKDWNYQVRELCAEQDLDEREKYWIDYYVRMPNYITRNELLAGNDIVKSNYHRIQQIENKQNKAIKKCLGYLTITLHETSLEIGVKSTKKGIPKQISKKSFAELLQILQIKKGEK